MNTKIASIILDLVALIAAALLIALGYAPASTLVSVLSVLVAVRAGKKGTNDDDDDTGASPPGTPRLGGASPRATPVKESSAVMMIARGVARWGRELSRTVTVIDIAAALVVGLALASLTACQSPILQRRLADAYDVANCLAVNSDSQGAFPRKDCFLMSNINRTIDVSTTVGSFDAAQDCTTMRAEGRTFIYKGTAGDKVELWVSNDGTNYIKLRDIAGASVIFSTSERFGYVKSKRIAGTAAASLVLSGAEETNATGPAGPTTLGNASLTGTASTTDTTVTPLLTFTPGGNGTFSALVHLQGTKDDGTAYSAVWLALWKKVAGTVTAIGCRAVSEETSSLDPGACTATVSAGVAKFNVVGISATNITWTGYAALLATG